MKTIAFHNLGCKVNSYELDVMLQIMKEKGYEIVPFDQKADVYVINTCTVTNIADRKSRQMLHRAKQKNPEAVVVAVGCYVQTDLEGVEKDEAIDLAIGNNRKKDIAQILERFLAEREAAQPKDGPTGKNDAPQPKDGPTGKNDAPQPKDKTLGGSTVPDIAHEKEYEEMTLKTTAEHTRAYVKIQDGCNQFCSYCAIPLARGRVRSRKEEDILREIQGIAQAGYQEIVLTGIHVGSYGIDFEKDYRGETKLIDLIEKIHEIPGIRRIRMSSVEPRIMTQEAAARLAALPKVCPHFHLSLQSGCDETLKRMNRHYGTQQFYDSVQAIRNAYAPRIPAITTDVIVGFPGETEEEFARTKAFLEKVGFYEMHVFKYSKRKGTRAAVMEGQIPEPVKAQRSDELLEMDRQKSIAFRRQKLGSVAEVLFEEEKTILGKRYFLGHTEDYVRVAVADKPRGEAGKRGELVPVELMDFLTEDILLGNETDLF